jgi:hypothetical protein
LASERFGFGFGKNFEFRTTVETASHFVGGKTTGAEGEVIVRTNRRARNSEIFWETTPSAEDNPTGVAITDHQQITLGSATPTTCTEEVAQSISAVVI